MHPTTLAYKPPNRDVVELIQRLGGHHTETIRILRTLHAEHGHLTPHLISEVARELQLPASRVNGIATFYSMLTTPAPPEKTIRICDGPYCMMRGTGDLLCQIQAQLGGSWTITRTSCLGLCDRAPAALVRDSQVGPLQLEHMKRYEVGWCGEVSDYRRPRPGEVRVLLPDPETAGDALESAFNKGSFPALQKALRMSPEAVLHELENSQLRGLGGGFPAGRKWRFVASQKRTPKYVVCNADESEPLSFKDRVLLDLCPQLVLEGMAIVAYAVGAEAGYVYIRGEYRAQVERLLGTIAEAEDRGWLGSRIGGSAFSYPVHVHQGAGAYICGEETALLESLEGSRGEPRVRPPFPADRGFHGQPTVVSNEPQQNLATACTIQVHEGLAVQTETPRLVEMRKAILELLLEDYADSGYAAGDRDNTEFERWLAHYGVRRPAGSSARLRYPINADPNPVLWVDMNKCILCTRCVRACSDIQGRFVWGVGERGHRARIMAGADTGLLEARCESCGTCVAYCPTGALDDRMAVGLGKPEKLVATTCSFCGVECQLDINVRDGRIIRVTTRPESPVNGLQLCVKGRYGYDFVHHANRLMRPQVRRYLLEVRPRPASGRDDWMPVDWETALNLVAEKLTAIKTESGPDSIALFASAKCTNEENYLMQKFARQVVGTNNLDHCARLCHSSTVSGLTLCFGSGAMSNTMEDVARDAKALFIIGSNTTEQHPVFGTKLRQAALQRGVPLIVADPRQIDITEFASLHLRHRPGSDVALINGIMRIVIENGWHDRQFIENRCTGLDEFHAAVLTYTPERVSEITGVPVEHLHQAADIMAHYHPMAVIWSMGITQHTSGVLNVLALGNLQMLLGNMGVPGGGVNPLRGQNNVQGACDVGALPDYFPGYQPVKAQAAQAKFTAAWQLEPASWTPDQAPSFSLRGTPGLTVTEMTDRAGKEMRCLYIVGENPAMTDPDVGHAQRCMAACEFVVLQEIFPSETSAIADVLLPGVSWAEKAGTFTNTERRIQLVQQAIDPVGEARADWSIVADLARRMIQRENRAPVGPHAAWQYKDPSEIMSEIAALTPSYGGGSYPRLERGEQLHWPAPNPDHPGTPILHIGRFTRGKGKFHVTEYLPPQEMPDGEYPMIMTTGRVLYHWHGAEMTRRSQALLELYPETVVEISPEDAAKAGLNGKTIVRIKSRRGEMTARALITDRVCPGLIFGNFHFPGAQNVNNLTIEALDPVAKIPEYKVCAVRIEPI